MTTIRDFLDLLSCNYTIPYVCYDADGAPVGIDKADLTINQAIFGAGDFLSELMQLHGHPDGPVILSTILGISWIAVITGDARERRRYHVLGPMAEQTLTRETVTASLNPFLQYIPATQLPAVIRSLMEIPGIPPLISRQYAVMLYYVLTGRRCGLSEIYDCLSHSQFFPNHAAPVTPPSDHDAVSASQSWHFENELIRAVREGDPNYLSGMYEDYTHVLPRVIYPKDPVRSSKDLSILFLAYNTHAAIEGGISPETAYQLQTSYLHMIEQSQTMPELASINSSSFEDFLMRVHRHRFAQSSCSREILHCQEYIRLHLGENLNLTRLAEHFHYTPYYFSRKFKAECGYSIQDYIRRERVRRAQHLLKTTAATVTQIGEQLGFSSTTVFCTAFRRYTGMSPTAYRESGDTVSV